MLRKTLFFWLVLAGLSVNGFADSESNDYYMFENDITPATKWHANVKLRTQVDLNENDEADTLTRFRFRAGIRHSVTDKAIIYTGITTSGTDPRFSSSLSTQTLDSPNIKLDFGFAKLRSHRTITGVGKMVNPIWSPSDLLWDRDIRPLGVATKWRLIKQKRFQASLTGGFFALSNQPQADPTYYIVSPAVKWQPSQDLLARAAVSAVQFSNIQGTSFATSSGTNATTDGVLSHDTDAITAAALLKWQIGKKRSIQIFGESVINHAISDNNLGILGGFSYGKQSLSQLGDWKLSFSYRYFQQDAWPDVLPEAESFGGQTDIKGLRTRFLLGLGHQSAVGVNFIHHQPILDTDRQTESAIQFDYRLWI